MIGTIVKGAEFGGRHAKIQLRKRRKEEGEGNFLFSKYLITNEKRTDTLGFFFSNSDIQVSHVDSYKIQ